MPWIAIIAMLVTGALVGRRFRAPMLLAAALASLAVAAAVAVGEGGGLGHFLFLAVVQLAALEAGYLIGLFSSRLPGADGAVQPLTAGREEGVGGA